MSSARHLYRFHLGLAALGGGTVAAAAVVALTRISPGLPTTGELLAACRQIVPLAPGAGLPLVLLFAALGLAVAVLGVRSLCRQLALQRRFLRTLRPDEETEIDGVTVTVIHGTRPTGFCAGLLRPRIFVSSAAISQLTGTELAAVVAHEAHHRAQRDPLRILAARVLADAFFFLPALRNLSERYRQLAELAADEAAAKAAGATALASALLRFGERGGEAAPVVGIAPERVEHLLGGTPRWRLPLPILGGSLVIIAGLLGLVLSAPALIDSESVSLATVLAQTCMVAMFIAPVALAGGALWISRGWLRRRLPLR